MTIPRTIVLDEHTLGVVYPNGLQILHASVSRGASFYPNDGVIPFDPVLKAGRFRAATEQDFKDYRVQFHPDYLKPL